MKTWFEANSFSDWLTGCLSHTGDAPYSTSWNEA
jgi:hypothetical protein